MWGITYMYLYAFVCVKAFDPVVRIDGEELAEQRTSMIHDREQSCLPDLGGGVSGVGS